MDNKLATQRLFRGILLRNASSNEEKFFAALFDNRSLSHEQLAVLGWQSDEFSTKVTPLLLVNYALSGSVDGLGLIGWYNAPTGAPLVNSSTNATLKSIEIMLAAYGVSTTQSAAALANSIQVAATRMGFSVTSQVTASLADEVINGRLNLPELFYNAALATSTQNTQLLQQLSSALLKSLLGEITSQPSQAAIPIASATEIINDYLAPSLELANATTIFESSLNNGSLDPVTLTLVGAAWKGKVGDVVTVSATLPTGLSARINVTGTQTAEITFSGKAKLHEASASTTISLKFSDTNFIGAKATDISTLDKGVLTIPLQFYDNEPWTISNTALTIFGNHSTAIIDLASDTGKIGTYSLDATTLGSITTVDARNITGTPLTLTGDSNPNTLYGNNAGTIFQGGAGDDTLFGSTNKSSDTFVFESVTAAGTSFITGNGFDTIYNFEVGSGGDKLDFRKFLGIPSVAASTVAASALSTNPANGQILTITESGSALDTEAAIGALLNASPPSVPYKAVLITAGVPAPGDPGVAHVWFVSNRSAAGSLTTIESADEIVKVADLIGVNNLSLLSLGNDNFVI